MALLGGCTPPLLRQGTPAELQGAWLAFLVDGRTTREEVLLRLGTPNAHFEGERILTYAFSRTSENGWIRAGRSWPLGQSAARPGNPVPEYQSYRVSNLVLVFAADDRLSRHSLVVPE